MSSLQKIIAVLSVTCYLAMSSIAVASALPMAIGNGKSTQSTDYFDNSSESQAEKTDLAMPCHQGGNAATDDVSTSNHCKMLCAAIGHVVVSTEVVDISPTFNSGYPSIEAHGLISTQLTIEQQPPK
jgi:hypothetical protein